MMSFSDFLSIRYFPLKSAENTGTNTNTGLFGVKQ